MALHRRGDPSTTVERQPHVTLSGMKGAFGVIEPRGAKRTAVASSLQIRFELAVLRLERLQWLRVRDVHAPELGLPGVVARLVEAVLPAKLFVGSPASASRRKPMICSSVYRFFIGPISISG